MDEVTEARNKSIAEVMYLERKDGLFQQIEGSTVGEDSCVKLGKVTGLYRRIVVPPAPMDESSATFEEDLTAWQEAMDRSRADDVVMFTVPGEHFPEFVYAEPVDLPFDETPQTRQKDEAKNDEQQ